MLTIRWISKLANQAFSQCNRLYNIMSLTNLRNGSLRYPTKINRCRPTTETLSDHLKSSPIFFLQTNIPLAEQSLKSEPFNQVLSKRVFEQTKARGGNVPRQPPPLDHGAELVDCAESTFRLVKKSPQVPKSSPQNNNWTDCGRRQ